MDCLLESKCQLFVSNRAILKEVFPLESEYMLLAGAMLLTAGNHMAYAERLRETETVLKSKTGLFSVFRSNLKIPVVCQMTLAGNGDRFLDKLTDIYGYLKKGAWFDNDFKAMAALLLCDMPDGANIQPYIDRTEDLIERMRDNHFWLTDNADLPLAAVMSLSCKNMDDLTEDAEQCFALLKDIFRDRNALQSLSHVLALGDAPASFKCGRCRALYTQIQSQNRRFGTGYELPFLGVAALTDAPVEALVANMLDADAWLSKQDGFGNFLMGKKRRLGYCALLSVLILDNETNFTVGTTLSVSIGALIAQQLCLAASVGMVAASATHHS